MFNRGLNFVSGRCGSLLRILEEANTAQLGAGMVSTTEARGLMERSCSLPWDEREGNSVVPKVDSDFKASQCVETSRGEERRLGVRRWADRSHGRYDTAR